MDDDLAYDILNLVTDDDDATKQAGGDDSDVEKIITTIQLKNFVVGGKLQVENAKINVEKIANFFPAVKLQRTVFTAAVFILASSARNTSCSVYGNARVASMGTCTLESAILGLWRQVWHINTIFRIPCTLTGLYVANVVAVVKIFEIDLEYLRTNFAHQFAPKTTFPGLYYKPDGTSTENKKIVMGIFRSGYVTLMGGDNEAELKTAFREVYTKYLIHARKRIFSN